jgi:ABC-type transporter Mla maintaining outer membrane lipid asymmetry permease subunit MlaE
MACHLNRTGSLQRFRWPATITENAMGTIRVEGGESAMSMLRDFFKFIGKVSCFGVKALVGAFQPPLEWEFFLGQIEEIGWRSLPLILAAGFALGVVMSMHTRGTLVQFGAEATCRD